MKPSYSVAFAAFTLAACNSSHPKIVDGGAPDLTTVIHTDAASLPIPIKHVVLIIKENHTFDNYFSGFPGAETANTYTTKDGVVHNCGQAPDATPRDLSHVHADALTEWNGGAMNGWEDVTGSSVNGDNLAWAQYKETDIPNYWAYARQYAIGDHFFANVLGQSFPGHLFTIAAQAGWAYDDPPLGLYTVHPYWGCDEPPNDMVPVLQNGTCTVQNVRPCFTMHSVPDILPQGVTWKFYGTNYTNLAPVAALQEIWSMFDAIDSVRNGPAWANIVDTSEFMADITNGTLPNVSWLVDQELETDEHPDTPGGSICKGENWTVQMINALAGSTYWNDTAILFTMDDHGGWYDHVPPPRQYGCDAQHPYGLGFRLPIIAISAYAKQHFVFKEVAEQASLAAFVERVFNAPPVSSLDSAAQDGQANDLMGMFDFTQTPQAPLILPLRTCPTM